MPTHQATGELRQNVFYRSHGFYSVDVGRGSTIALGACLTPTLITPIFLGPATWTAYWTAFEKAFIDTNWNLMSIIETETRSRLVRHPAPDGVAHDDGLQDDSQDAVSSSARELPLPRPQMVDSKSRIIWPYIIGVTLFHLLIPLAFLSYVFSWWGVLWLPVGNYLFCSMGIGAGYHRLLTHRGFKCPLWFEHLLAILGVCNLQESPARWVVVHRMHHQHSDEQPDPHTPQVSWFWGHVGWLFIENRELTSAETYHKYAGDVLADPFYMRLERNLLYFWVYAIQAALFIVAGLIVGYCFTGAAAGSIQMGVKWLLWGVVYRTIFTWHVTWGVNSAAHLWGYQNYATRENSRNNWLIALGTNGEGWHNNHHADPRAAQHGHRWWELDFTYVTICLWERLGLAWDVLRPNQSLLERRKRI